MPETPADSPERVALVQQTTTAFLLSALHGADDAWSQLRTVLQDGARPLGHLESK